MPDSPERPAAGGPRALHALAVLALLATYTGALYRRALAIGVLSDGWVLLEIGSQGWRKAPFVLLSYHTIPVTNLLMAVLWKLFGLHQRWYQAVNLAEMVLVGWLLYLLGRALFRQGRVALLASLLFLANSSFFEVPFWPTVGNFQSLAALLYLAGLLAMARAFRSPRPWLWVFLFSLCGLAAFFTYEPAVSMLGVGLLYAALVPAREDEALTLRGRVRRTLVAFAATLPAIAVVLGSKVYTASQGYQALFVPNDLAALKLRLYLLVRGCIAIFTLRGADHRIYRILTFGTLSPGGTRQTQICIAVWLAGLALAGALLVWRTRSPAVRFLALWFAAHMVIVSAATGIVSRHFYLGALPAALLTSWLIWSAADRIAARISPPEGQGQTGAILAGLVLTLLVAGSVSDLDAAAAINRQASEATRQTVDIVNRRLAQEPAATPRIALVNMPAILARDGVGAYAFVNGLHQVLQLSTGGRIRNPELFYTYATFADGKFANASRPITFGELNRRVSDPGSLVLMYDGRTQTVRELDRATWRAPESYDPASAPYLEWLAGSWPWLRVYAGQPLELPVAVTPERSWISLRYLRQPGVAFTVADGSGPKLEVRAPDGAPPSWPVVTFPAVGRGEVAALTLQPTSEVWLAAAGSFSPPAAYTPESAPFLSWSTRPFPHFPVEAPVRLPLRQCPRDPCTLVIEYLAEKGRDFSFAAGEGPSRSFAFGDVAAPEWRSAAIPLPSSGGAILWIEPAGSTPVLIRRLGWDSPSLIR